MTRKKILTVPSEIVNFGHDNSEFDLVMSRGDYLSKNERQKYMIIDILGTGTFGQVVRCVSNEGEEVAIKVVKNQPKYYHYEMNEVKILHKLLYNNLTKTFVEIRDAFIYKNHLCIVEELLGNNLYSFLKMTRFNGLDHQILKSILLQILEGIVQLQCLGITHCDLKPENILIADYNSSKIKIIDFGSAFSTPQGSHFYVQSRYYRAPEVIMGIPYGSSCDIWSFGCIAYELYVGNPLFPGKDNIDQIGRIYGLFGSLPQFMLEHGKNSSLYFEKENNYRIIKPSEKFTLKDMENTIKRKHGDLKDDETFIEMLKKALHPSHLLRADARTLIKSNYFKHRKTQDDLSKADAFRKGIQNEPVIKEKQRHTSITNVSFPGKKVKTTDSRRKISVYGISYENNAKNKKEEN